MNKKFWLILLFLPVLVLAKDKHPCTEEPLPLATEDQLLQVVFCEYPNAKVLRFELDENEAGEPIYHVRLLEGEKIHVLVYQLANGKLLEEE
ncbi:hypothetical protein [Salinibius halmophilus]|uniref:hypothetical protein n=1 Tax=Salinibius halmophilus TaxID=1853216 RepID=UPI000E6752A3|nr:hypothetical protein [Salinibius halmophilus]